MSQTHCLICKREFDMPPIDDEELAAEIALGAVVALELCDDCQERVTEGGDA